jgi:hypothetical protein
MSTPNRKPYPSDVSDDESALVADEQDRAQVQELAETAQEVTGDHVNLAYVDQGYTAFACLMLARLVHAFSC